MINSRKDLENYIRADRQRNIGSIGFLKYRLGLFMKSESCIAFHYLTALRHCEYTTIHERIFGTGYWPAIGKSDFPVAEVNTKSQSA